MTKTVADGVRGALDDTAAGLRVRKFDTVAEMAQFCTEQNEVRDHPVEMEVRIYQPDIDGSSKYQHGLRVYEQRPTGKVYLCSDLTFDSYDALRSELDAIGCTDFGLPG